MEYLSIYLGQRLPNFFLKRQIGNRVFLWAIQSLSHLLNFVIIMWDISMDSGLRLCTSNTLFTKTGGWTVANWLWTCDLIMFNFSQQCFLVFNG